MAGGRTLARFLTAAALSLVAATASSSAPLPIAEARWVPPERVVAALTSQPRECLAEPESRAERRAVAIGRAAFRAPLLLGGQAARAGLSCASCHRSGRGNPDFRFPGLSGEPGTADVTASLMSSHRGDGAFNPVPIPDLAAPPHRVSRAAGDPALAAFIRGLIVEEFDGPEPPAAVLAGLAAYVRALKADACRSAARPVTVARAAAEVDEAVAAARLAARRQDLETARFLVGAARSALGRIDERFRLDGLGEARRVLKKADRELHAVAETLRDRPAAAEAAVGRWQERWPSRLRLLQRLEPRSLFSHEVLGRQLDR